MAELTRRNKKPKASKSTIEQTETRSGNELQKMEEGTEGLQTMEEGTDVKSTKQVTYASGFRFFSFSFTL